MTDAIQGKVKKFFSTFPHKKFNKNDSLIIPGKTDTVFYLNEGIVRMYFVSQKGNEITSTFFSKGAFIPAAWIIGNIKNTYYYDACTDVQTHYVSKEKVTEFLKGNPDCLYNLLERIAQGTNALLLHNEYIAEASAQKKLIYALSMLAKRFGKKENNAIIIPFSLDETQIASFSGVVRETASRELHKLKKQHVLAFEKEKIIIHNNHLFEDFINIF